VVLVTHEADIADYARRIVRVRDGLILSDEQTGARERQIVDTAGAGIR
jgi:putative ABC transport system ATP-binding protein